MEYNISYTNNNSNHDPEVVQYTDTTGRPILPDGENYNMIVERFYIDNNLPVMIVDMGDYTGEVTNTAYSMYCNGTVYPIYFTEPFTKEYMDTNDYLPQAINGKQPFNSYFFLHSIESFVSMINSTFATIQTAVGSTNMPYQRYLTFNSSSGQLIFWRVSEDSEVIYFNEALYQLFRTCNFKYSYGITEDDDNWYELNFPTHLYSYPSTSSPYAYQNLGDTYTICQNPSYVNCLSNFCPVNSVVIVAGGIPINSAIMPNQVAFNTDTTIETYGNTGSKATQIVVSDYKLGIDMDNQYVPYLLYNPSIKRKVRLNGSILDTMTIKFYWTDKQNNLHPIYLPYKGTFSIKLKFELAD